MSKTLQKDISFSGAGKKMNLNLNFHIYSLICMYNMKDRNIINNNYCTLHTHISTRK